MPHVWVSDCLTVRVAACLTVRVAACLTVRVSDCPSFWSIFVFSDRFSCFPDRFSWIFVNFREFWWILMISGAAGYPDLYHGVPLGSVPCHYPITPGTPPWPLPPASTRLASPGTPSARVWAAVSGSPGSFCNQHCFSDHFSLTPWPLFHQNPCFSSKSVFIIPVWERVFCRKC